MLRMGAAARAAGRTRFQLRLRCTLVGDNDGESDWTNCISGDSPNPASLPFLQVTPEP